MPAQPELKKYIDKRICIQMNGNRRVMGQLRGYDVYMNLVLDEAVEDLPNGEKVRMGMCCVRGNSIILVEALDRMDERQNRG
ncbi:like-Sm ribonucleo protein [Aulographum hederae CBS 113979]|uniref:Small nuclear ribonucleoprotein G n=1 Tax=Aulographum hederae CBS 113979 TaxID=1176131 RepID=A0A6G1H937_9PEZI|nr:like-Sm ribonucleo protein [Aulographum hederae CBS 113979]